eukprot:TRINITY_DN31038_c0_g1_i1.p1 TRINITY_DN31038_c0_g1~~TRINITY_DN31038_c0_g1_i1.p1  ORF type:complete len:160 (+),score=14.53 TRINITY_DN31038_c0_g1_i1:287-766(+)
MTPELSPDASSVAILNLASSSLVGDLHSAESLMKVLAMGSLPIDERSRSMQVFVKALSQDARCLAVRVLADMLVKSRPDDFRVRNLLVQFLELDVLCQASCPIAAQALATKSSRGDQQAKDALRAFLTKRFPQMLASLLGPRPDEGKLRLLVELAIKTG